MNYYIESGVPSVEKYIELSTMAGLSRKSKEAAGIGLANTVYGAVAYADGAEVGMGRIVGDGGCYFAIADMAVLPTHQGRGVGRLIMNALLAFLQENAPSSAFVSLFADHGTPDFYRKFGFESAEAPVSSGMVLRLGQAR